MSLYPLQVNPSTGEPYLPLKSHPGIIITPPRLSDIPVLPDILNHPDVHIWLSGPPYPYLLEHSQYWVTEKVQETGQVLKELEGTDSLKIVGTCPVRYIRQVNEDGTDTLIGDIALERCQTMDLALSPSNKLLNDQRETGDPEILWSVGYFLAATHAGKGIMTSALGAVLEQWAVPRMGVCRILCLAYRDNHGSRKVLEKNGFIFREIREGYLEAKGKKYDMQIFDWSISM